MEIATSVTVTDREVPRPLSAADKFLRRLATRYKESGIGHWLPLIFATKVNIWDKFLTDVKQGILPGILKKIPKKQLVKYTRNHLPFVASAGIIVTAFVVTALFTAAKKRKRQKQV